MISFTLSRPTYWLLVGAFIFFGSCSIWTMLHTKAYDANTIVKLQMEFSEIKTPPDARISGNVLAASKITVQAVYADYLSDGAEKEISGYYRANLDLRGWRQKEEDGRKMQFCKEDIDATLEFMEKTSLGVRYYFGITRENGLRRKTGC